MPVVIFINRKRFPFFLLFYLFITTVFFIDVVNTDTTGLTDNNSLRYYFDICILLFLLYNTIRHITFYLHAMFSKSSRLVVSAEGIDDELTIYSLGKLQWMDVAEIRKRKTLFTTVLLVILKNPAVAIERHSRWKRVSLWQLTKKWGTPFIIPRKLINYNIDELAEIMEGYRAEAEAKYFRTFPPGH